MLTMINHAVIEKKTVDACPFITVSISKRNLGKQESGKNRSKNIRLEMCETKFFIPGTGNFFFSGPGSGTETGSAHL